MRAQDITADAEKLSRAHLITVALLVGALHQHIDHGLIKVGKGLLHSAPQCCGQHI